MPPIGNSRVSSMTGLAGYEGSPISYRSVDSFEDGNILEYSGDAGSFNVVAESILSFDAPDGSHVLEGTQTSGNFNSLASTSGLNSYPAPGEQFRCWTRLGSTPDQAVRIAWAFHDDTDMGGNSRYYNARLNRGSSTFELQVRDGDSPNTLDSASYSYSDNTAYEVDIIWDDGTTPQTLTLKLLDINGNELAKVSAQDDTHTSQEGVGYAVNSGSNSTAHIDYYRAGSGVK